jgi:hypothetical protein
MGAYARLYGGIEERLTAAEDLRSNGAGGHAMWRFVEESHGALGSSRPPRVGVPRHVVGGAGHGHRRHGPDDRRQRAAGVERT